LPFQLAIGIGFLFHRQLAAQLIDFAIEFIAVLIPQRVVAVNQAVGLGDLFAKRSVGVEPLCRAVQQARFVRPFAGDAVFAVRNRPDAM